ncbi:50S ribosomal protein L25 [Pelolinea submarina]|uniref:Large ribosomal subunit protein bL25 n=1 Tax=Pelolinea submarina TaxID=913107 RepID=A0A347ZT84_9CHLR|nr:50S ribosomal protein L25 [Pelolinea submarina]REG10910.1 LSU ribosomal protein L25P [Pelolinea submarina]BBB48515.1 large subunit ribosomal protein L25 [Pelolinea submarina]
MEKVILEAEKRELVGKKVSRLRKEGKIPAVVYGRDYEATPITLDLRNTTNTLAKVSSSTILTLVLDGKEQSTLIREIQKDYIRNEILHIDFLAVSSKEKLRTNVSISLFGEAPALEEFDALLVNGIENIEVECYPQDLPESIEIDLSVLKELGDAIYVKDIPAPANVEFLTDGEELVVIATAQKEEAVEEEEEIAEVTGEGEPEVIEHGKKEEEEEE